MAGERYNVFAGSGRGIFSKYFILGREEDFGSFLYIGVFEQIWSTSCQNDAQTQLPKSLQNPVRLL